MPPKSVRAHSQLRFRRGCTVFSSAKRIASICFGFIVLHCLKVSHRRGLATYRFQRRSMCAPHDDPSSRSRRTASWKVVPTTLSVELSPRQPDPKNIQLSEPRAKGKTDDAHSAVPVSAQRLMQPTRLAARAN